MTYEQESKEYYPGAEEDEEGLQAWSTVNLDKREEEEEEVSRNNWVLSGNREEEG